MAKLGKFRLTQAAFDGEWVSVGPEHDPYRVRVRGQTDAYRDKLNVRGQRAAIDLNRANMQERKKSGQILWTAQNLPTTVSERIEAEVMAEECLLDVADLYHDAEDGAPEGAVGPPVSIAEYREMIADPFFKDFYFHVWLAVQKVTQAREGDEEPITKNSSTASITS